MNENHGFEVGDKVRIRRNLFGFHYGNAPELLFWDRHRTELTISGIHGSQIEVRERPDEVPYSVLTDEVELVEKASEPYADAKTIRQLREDKSELLLALKPFAKRWGNVAHAQDFAETVYQKHAGPQYTEAAMERLRHLHEAEKAIGETPSDALCIASNSDGITSYYNGEVVAKWLCDDICWVSADQTRHLNSPMVADHVVDRDDLLAFMWLEDE